MGTFYALVLLNPDTPAADIVDRIDVLLKPFDAHTKLEPCALPCWRCAGPEADAEADVVEQKYEHLMRNYTRLPLARRPAWRDYVMAYSKEVCEVVFASPRYEGVKPDCPRCGGTGIIQDSYNRWNEFRVWWASWGAEILPEAVQTPEGVYPDYAPLSQIPKEALNVYAIITPDGAWYDVWDASGDKDWAQLRNDLIQQYRGCLAVKCTMKV